MHHESCLQRCLDLALLGAGHVAPNPMVGAVLVHDGRIIGEGWHRRYGGPHAEINALTSVAPADRPLIEHATLYCNLEPCFHHGRTPPCVDAVLAAGIRHVVVSATDPNPLVAGKSLEKMRDAGVEVVAGLLEREAQWLNRVFVHWITTGAPYVVLKWAQSADGNMGLPGKRVPLSGPAARRLVHRWRSELDAILVGYATAAIDNPQLDARLFPGGRNPLRIVYDRRGLLPATHHVFDGRQETLVLGPERTDAAGNTRFLDAYAPEAVCRSLALEKRSSLLVEGGPTTLNRWMAAGCWHEIRVLESPGNLPGGIPAPQLPDGAVERARYPLGEDVVRVYTRRTG